MTITIKVDGPPGSGKTMFLKLLKSSLKKELRDLDELHHDIANHALVATVPDDYLTVFLPKNLAELIKP